MLEYFLFICLFLEQDHDNDLINEINLRYFWRSNRIN